MKGVGNADCMDAQGQTRKEGEEYERASGKFKYKCEQGEEQVSGECGKTEKDPIYPGCSQMVFWVDRAD